MKTKIMSLLIQALALLVCSSFEVQGTTSEICSDIQTPLAQVINSLSHQLTNELEGNDNLIFSPLSITLALSMTYLGAGGTTAEQMENVLGFREQGFSPEELHSRFQDLLSLLHNDTADFSLLIANGIFVQTDYSISQDFVDDLRNFYRAQTETVDFAGDGEGAKDEINRWADERTEHKIETLLQEPLGTDTRLALLNAVYFKGYWKFPFDKRFTFESTFYKTDGSTKSVHYMVFTKELPYLEDSTTNYQFLELPYEGDHIAMLLALPEDTNSFPDIELTPATLCRIRLGLQETKLDVKLPRFQMEYKTELSEIMKNLGMGDLFSQENANLTGIRRQNDLYASLMIHEAVIEVNEEGTEAAAVTSLSFSARSMRRERPIFRADHPFLFCILDKRSGIILFLGRVNDP